MSYKEDKKITVSILLILSTLVKTDSEKNTTFIIAKKCSHIKLIPSDSIIF